MAYSFDDAASPERHTTQYFEMFCNRGIYHQGWTAVTRHSHPVGDGRELPALDDDVWELYAPDDWTQAHDLAAEQPEQLARAAAPVPDRGGEVQRPPARRPPRRALQPRPRRPAAARPRQPADPVRRHGPADRELGHRRSKNKSHAVTAQIEVPEGGAEGVIIAQGGAFGGWSASTPRTASRPTATTCSACSGSRSTARTPLPPGDHQVRMEFAYDGGGLGKGGTVDALRRRRRRSARAASTRPCRCSSRPTRPPTSAPTPARR